MRLASAAVVIGWLVAASVASGCSPLRKIPLNGVEIEAQPALLGAFLDDAPVTTLQAWRNRRVPLLRDAFQRSVYGAMPAPAPARVVARRVLDDNAYGGLGVLEQVTLRAGDAAPFNLAIARPKGAGPHPVIIAQTFCGNHRATPRPGVETLGPYPDFCDNRVMGALVTAVMGRHLSTPPVKTILRRGYAFVAQYGGDIAPDNGAAAEPALKALTPQNTTLPRTGAIAAWAWAYSRAVDFIDGEAAFDHARVAVWGHSRNGKSALLAAAFDPRIDLVIAHQSGTGGATLSRSPHGESVAQITTAYPHWFAPGFADYAGREDELPVDQHQLLALIAPRPVLLGNARRDGWSDPAGAFHAAKAAAPAYALYGSAGLAQTSMRATDVEADVAFFLRGGVHGVTSGDWRTFLAFLDAHFAPDAL